jgi:hypothetical protein
MWKREQTTMAMRLMGLRFIVNTVDCTQPICSMRCQGDALEKNIDRQRVDNDDDNNDKKGEREKAQERIRMESVRLRR